MKLSMFSQLALPGIESGQDADSLSDIEHIWQTMWRHGFYRGGPVFMSALSGIDIALWDLKGMHPLMMELVCS